MNETYEAVFIIKDYKDIEKIKEIIKEIDEIVINEGYEIYNRKDYGRKNLAYEIEKKKRDITMSLILEMLVRRKMQEKKLKEILIQWKMYWYS